MTSLTTGFMNCLTYGKDENTCACQFIPIPPFVIYLLVQDCDRKVLIDTPKFANSKSQISNEFSNFDENTS